MCVVECVCIKVRSCVCSCFHFPRSGGSLQRPCPPPVIWLWQSRGDIIVCSRSPHAKQSVHVFAVCTLHRTPPLSSQCHQKADSWVWCSIVFSALWKCAHTYLFTVSESMHTLRHTLKHTLRHTLRSCCHPQFAPVPSHFSQMDKETHTHIQKEILTASNADWHRDKEKKEEKSRTSKFFGSNQFYL